MIFIETEVDECAAGRPNPQKSPAVVKQAIVNKKDIPRIIGRLIMRDSRCKYWLSLEMYSTVISAHRPGSSTLRSERRSCIHCWISPWLAVRPAFARRVHPTRGVSPPAFWRSASCNGCCWLSRGCRQSRLLPRYQADSLASTIVFVRNCTARSPPG